MNFFAERATRELIAREYAVQAQNHVQTLLRYTEQARREVDAIEALPDLVSVERPRGPAARATRRSWSGGRRPWRRQRLTSAVELYNRSGKLVSRFPLNIPEYTAAAVQSSAGCDWDVFVEVAPFGSEERRMLHAERRICTVDAAGVRSQQGAVILHVLFEYETLPFITSQNPVLRGRPGGRSHRPRKAPPAATSRSRSTAGACSRSTPRGVRPGRSPTRCSPSSTPRASRSGRRPTPAA